MNRKTTILLFSLALSLPLGAWADSIPVVKVSDDQTTLTFTYDDAANVNGSTVCELNTGQQDPDWLPSAYYFNDDKTTWPSFSKVVFEPAFDKARPEDMHRWFDHCYKLTTIEGMEYLHTDEVRYMSYTFRNCESLHNLDLSHFNTGQVRDMKYMFSGCNFKTLDLSSFNTELVEYFNFMFSDCPNLRTVNLGSFKVTNYRYHQPNLSGMFQRCRSLQSLDISNFQLENEINGITWSSTMTSMIDYCTSLKYIFIGSNKLTNPGGDRLFDELGTTADKPLTIFVSDQFNRTNVTKNPVSGKDNVYSYKGGFVRFGALVDELATTDPETTAYPTGILVRRSIKANTWSTLCLPFAMTAGQVADAFGSDAKVAEFTGMSLLGSRDSVTLNFNTLDGDLEANHPYLLYLTQPVDSTFFVDGAAINDVAGRPEVTCQATDSDGEPWTVTFRGVYTQQSLTPLDPASQTMFFLSDNKFWTARFGFSGIKGLRAYFLMDNKLRAPAQFGLTVEGTTTAIDGFTATAPATGSQRPGIYTLSGQRVGDSLEGLPSGIYITGGKKVIKK